MEGAVRDDTTKLADLFMEIGGACLDFQQLLVQERQAIIGMRFEEVGELSVEKGRRLNVLAVARRDALKRLEDLASRHGVEPGGPAQVIAAMPPHVRGRLSGPYEAFLMGLRGVATLSAANRSLAEMNLETMNQRISEAATRRNDPGIYQRPGPASGAPREQAPLRVSTAA